MKIKLLRVMHLVVVFLLLLPVWTILAMGWLGVCIYASQVIDESPMEGFKVWWSYIKQGVYMNKDFIQNGL